MAELMVEQKNADDQTLKANAHSPENKVAMPVINTGTATQMTFECYFGPQWGAGQNITKTHAPFIDWKLDESSQSN